MAMHRMDDARTSLFLWRDKWSFSIVLCMDHVIDIVIV
jgi:hypothetical protein